MAIDENQKETTKAYRKNWSDIFRKGNKEVFYPRQKVEENTDEED